MFYISFHLFLYKEDDFHATKWIVGGCAPARLRKATCRPISCRLRKRYAWGAYTHFRVIRGKSAEVSIESRLYYVEDVLITGVKLPRYITTLLSYTASWSAVQTFDYVGGSSLLTYVHPLFYRKLHFFLLFFLSLDPNFQWQVGRNGKKKRSPRPLGPDLW